MYICIYIRISTHNVSAQSNTSSASTQPRTHAKYAQMTSALEWGRESGGHGDRGRRSI